MEALMCCCVGALAGACAAGILPGERAAGSGGPSGPGPGRAGATVAVRARAAVRGLGAAVLGCGLVPAGAADELADELMSLGRLGRTAGLGADRAAAVGAVAIASAAGAVLLALIAGTPAGFAVGAAAVPGALAARIARRRRDERRKLEAAMPEAFGALAISLGAGHSLPQALRFVGSRAEEPLCTELMRVSYAVTCGIPAADALDELLRRLPAPGLDLVALALKVSQRTGSPLKDLLTEASQQVGERIELARRLDVKTSQARMSAHLVACMPLVMIGFLMLFSADFQRGVTQPAGAVSVAAALVLNAAAWAIIRRIMRMEP